MRLYAFLYLTAFAALFLTTFAEEKEVFEIGEYREVRRWRHDDLDYRPGWSPRRNHRNPSRVEHRTIKFRYQRTVVVANEPREIPDKTEDADGKEPHHEFAHPGPQAEDEDPLADYNQEDHELDGQDLQTIHQQLKVKREEPQTVRKYSDQIAPFARGLRTLIPFGRSTRNQTRVAASKPDSVIESEAEPDDDSGKIAKRNAKDSGRAGKIASVKPNTSGPKPVKANPLGFKSPAPTVPGQPAPKPESSHDKAKEGHPTGSAHHSGGGAHPGSKAGHAPSAHTGQRHGSPEHAPSEKSRAHHVPPESRSHAEKPHTPHSKPSGQPEPHGSNPHPDKPHTQHSKPGEKSSPEGHVGKPTTVTHDGTLTAVVPFTPSPHIVTSTTHETLQPLTEKTIHSTKTVSAQNNDKPPVATSQ